MIKKHLFILTLLVAIALGVGSYLFSHQAGGDSLQGERLFPQLPDKASSIDRIQVSLPGGETLELARLEQQWLARDILGTERDYPANKDAIISLLNQLQQARIKEAKTKQPKLHARLEVAEPGQSGGGTRVLLGNKPDFAVILGKRDGSGHFVRKHKQRQVWLLESHIDAPATMSQWLNSRLFHLPDEAVLAISRGGEDGWRITREQGEWTLDAMPKGHSLSYDSVLTTLAEDVLSLQFAGIGIMDEAIVAKASELGSLSVIAGQQSQSLALMEYQDKLYARFAKGPYRHWLYQLDEVDRRIVTRRKNELLRQSAAKDSEN